MKKQQSKKHVSIKSVIITQRFSNNPLLEPIPHHPWESSAVFNPAAVDINGKVYLIYRSTSNDGRSYLGLAISNNGLTIDERLPEPIYPLRSIYELPKAPHVLGGTEDPRVTRIGDVLYMCYTAFDGNLPRLAFTSITVNDFLNRNWSTWTEPKIISPNDTPDKDCALFPEKINGKYVFIHRLGTDIMIDTVDDLEFKDKTYLGTKAVIESHPGQWDGKKVGISNPPIKTEKGWLVFYHGVSDVDGSYRVGTLLLDLQDVIKVIARTTSPIFEPEADYEKVGIVNNVIFPCGHVIKGNDIYLYYGGADKVVCGVKINAHELINELLH